MTVAASPTHPGSSSAWRARVARSSASPEAIGCSLVIELLPSSPRDASANSSLGDAAPTPPAWVQLVPAGVFRGRDGRGPYRLDARAVLEHFDAYGADLPVDFDHQSLEAEAKAGPVPAAGWIRELELRDGALWARVEWTARAAELIAGREYRYLSPVFRHTKDGRITALLGAGLTHYPNLHLTAVHSVHSQQGVSMDLTPIAQALGVSLDAEAAPDAAVAALARHAAALKAAAEAQPDPREWVPIAQHKAVADELAAMQATIAREKAEAAVTAAMSAGKLAPAMRAWALDYAAKDPKGFEAWANAAPVIVPLAGASAHAAGRVAPNPGAAMPSGPLTDEERYVCAQLGLAEADFVAHRQALGASRHA